MDCVVEVVRVPYQPGEDQLPPLATRERPGKCKQSLEPVVVRRCREERPRSSWRRGAGELERRILFEDSSLEPLQRTRRLEGEAVDEHRSHPAVGIERLCVAPRPVQGQHELLRKPLAQRVLCR